MTHQPFHPKQQKRKNRERNSNPFGGFGQQQKQPGGVPQGRNVFGHPDFQFADIDKQIVDKRLFDAETARLGRTGGNVFSKVAKTATSVRSAQGSTVAQRRNRSVFTIPRERKRGLTAQGLGVNVAPGPGLNIVI